LVERVCVARKTKLAAKKKKAEEAKVKKKLASKLFPYCLRDRHREWSALNAWEGHYPNKIELEIVYGRKNLSDVNPGWPNRIDINSGNGADQRGAYSQLLWAMAWLASAHQLIRSVGSAGRWNHAKHEELCALMLAHALEDLRLGVGLTTKSLDELLLYATGAFRRALETDRWETAIAPRLKGKAAPNKKGVVKKKMVISPEEKKQRRLAAKRKARKAKAEW
jgi:hypothetical protein